MAMAINQKDFLGANNLRAAQQRSRIENAQKKQGTNPNSTSQKKPNPKTKETDEQDERNEQNQEMDRFQQIALLEARGKQLQNASIKDEAAGEVLMVSNNFIDFASSSLIETGKATLEIIIGFLLLPAGYIMKVVKFGFDKQISELKTSSQKKKKDGEKLLAQAAKLRGITSPFKKSVNAALAPATNYIKEMITELFPLGFSPTEIIGSMEEKKQALYKILIRGAFFFFAFAIGLAFIVILITFLFKMLCEVNIFCDLAIKSGIAPFTIFNAVVK